MSQDDTIEYSALHWVKKELDTLLDEARGALEAYIEDDARSEELVESADKLRQAQGTLQMVELHGAALLAEEMVHLVQAVREGGVTSRDDAYEVLMRAILQLPDYLEHIQTGHRDIPIVLLPLLNDLRTTRNASLLSENVLFFPEMEGITGLDEGEEPPGAERGEDIQVLARRSRHAYQLGLLGLFRHKNVKPSLGRIQEVISSLRRAARDDAVRRLFWISGAVAEALADDALDASVTVKQLLGRVDRQIRVLIQEGERGLSRQMPGDLLKNLIYYVGRSRPGGDQVQAVKRAFRLNELLPEGIDLEQALEDIRGPNQQLLETVSRAIREDLAEVKDGLDVFMHNEDQPASELAPLVEKLHRMADTMAMLGMAEPREMALREADVIEEMVKDQSRHDDVVLMDVASRLLKLETAINGLVASRGRVTGRDGPLPNAFGDLTASESRTIVTTILHEALADIAKAKGAILDFMSEPARTEQLNDVPETLSRVAGALSMMSLDDVADVLLGVRGYLQQRVLAHGHVPDIDEQEALAESVAAVELYLETLDNGSGDPRPMLDTARQCLERLVVPAGTATDGGAASDATTVYTGVSPVSEEPTWVVTRPEPEAQGESLSSDADTVVREAGTPSPEAPDEAGASAELPNDTGTPAVAPTPEAEPKPEPERFAVMSGEPDEEILEIFLEEAQEEIERIREFLPQWRNNPADQEALTTVRRSFHTLKGSGRLVGAQLLGEFAWSMENLLNRVIDQTAPASPDVHQVLDEALRVLPALREQITGGPGDDEQVYGLMARAHALARGDREVPTPAAPPVAQPAAPVADAPAEPVAAEDASGDDDTLEMLVAAGEDTPTVILDVGDEGLPGLGGDTLDTAPQPFEPDLEEPESLAETAEQDADTVVTEKPEVSELELESEWVPGEAQPDISALDEVSQAGHDDETRLLRRDDLPAGFEPQEDAGARQWEDDAAPAQAEAPASGVAHIGALGDLQEESPARMDPTLLEIFRNETGQHLEVLRGLIHGAGQGGEEGLPVSDALLRAIHTLNGAARTAEVPEISEVCGPCERYIKARKDSDLPVPADVLPRFHALVDHVADVLSALEQGGAALPSGEALAGEMQLLLDEELARIEAQRQENAMRPPPFAAEFGGAQEPSPPAPAETEEKPPVAEVSAPVEVPPPDVADEQDLELVDIFLEEGVEILDSADNLLEAWRKSPSDPGTIAEIQRQLHTLKGGARMAGFRNIGDLSHALESLIIEISEGRNVPQPEMLDAVGAALDRLSTQLEQARSRQPVEAAPELIARITAFSAGAAEEALPVAEVEPETQDELSPVLDLDAESFYEEEAETVLLDVDDLPSDDTPGGFAERLEEAPTAEAPAPAAQTGAREPEEDARPARTSEAASAQELVRVRSEVLDNLVNYAGEVNIYHARLEQQITGFGFNLAELAQTVTRLREQLRKLELETEAQILFRYEKEKEEQGLEEDFDPLEMDRYSNIQQLSRALAESINDLVSIQEILSDQVRDSETLLLQQSRVSTDLQEGLMRTRMVQFANMAPRLRRVVRQTASELGRRVNLDVRGEGSELDRSVLERMVAPLEHMLRNAVYHGIESPEARKAAGKPETGHLDLEVSREGSEVVIRVKDDGSGINLKAVREKARGLGLISGDEALLTDEDVMQFILESGFSTAAEISQISGRGVGMDVVNSEIKQLGGTLSIESVQGKGTTFTVRLPFTLAINQALLVQVGEDLYAVPLSSIEGIVRMRSQDLAAYYEQDHPLYDYAGNTYEVKHLGVLLDVSQPHLHAEDIMYPVLLVRSGDHRIALHVDGLLGSREVVVKSVGPQVAKVRGISGATILGDGRVVLILDVPALVRIGAGVQLVYRAPDAELAEAAMPTVMVVDDSITIRKVTARMLERNNFRVITAKDGLDAVAQLQENVPDIMLLDIEMPRMDGYELATHMRNDSRLQNVPIIMITSRTGEKHRQRALDIGVNRYLGKPYQEADLLANIKDILPA
ncbi:histidine kinase [Thioalkalivibrio denitrificans]|uniref:Chemotaxis protein CheA n=1 Tax=Thioalkalivibrio denitrificans TaxID=108003 RepID=A0A1V3NUE1_9GAMM|nr:Hpt domain-containing protein [Thioalkalivibrio denitrificans]OOG28573.1 histidine kinase [Thioalkalivibrio denitrificans]